MTASGTTGFFISIFTDVVLPAALLERKQKQRKDRCRCLMGYNCLLQIDVFANNISACARRELELSECFQATQCYWMAK